MTRVALALGLLLAACATPLTATSGESKYVGFELIDAIEFDHGCAAQNIRLIRSGSQVVDLNVCGQVRRYRVVGWRQNVFPLWLDVTNLYPPSTLSSSAP